MLNRQKKIFAERVRNIVEQSSICIDNERIIHITASIGVAQWDNHQYQDKDEFLQQTDELLYRAKHAGRNCVVSQS